MAMSDHNVTDQFMALRTKSAGAKFAFWVPVTVGLIAILTAAKAGTQWTLDQRYVTQATVTASFAEQRKLFLDDKIFEIESLVPADERTPVQKALLERYKNQRDDAANIANAVK